MKVSFFRWLLLLLLVSHSARAESLPQWSDEDRARLLRGEIIAGADILVDGVSTTISDYNNDGWFDIYVTNNPPGNYHLMKHLL